MKMPELFIFGIFQSLKLSAVLRLYQYPSLAVYRVLVREAIAGLRHHD
jgi:hypothetical protein